MKSRHTHAILCGNRDENGTVVSPSKVGAPSPQVSLFEPTSKLALCGNRNQSTSYWCFNARRPYTQTARGPGICAPDMTRTCNPRLRRPVLYPVELRAQIVLRANVCRGAGAQVKRCERENARQPVKELRPFKMGCLLRPGLWPASACGDGRRSKPCQP